MRCPECQIVSSNLKPHLICAHKYSEQSAKFKESELRVMYLWAKQDKHGSTKSLPCHLCFKWHLRLDNHLKG